MTYTKDSKTGSASASKTFTVNNSEVQANNAFVTALSGSIAYAGRTYRPDADKKITAYKFTGDASGATWTVPSSLDGYDTITITTNPGQNDGSLTITGKTTLIVRRLPLLRLLPVSLKLQLFPWPPILLTKK